MPGKEIKAVVSAVFTSTIGKRAASVFDVCISFFGFDETKPSLAFDVIDSILT